jgi:hypothetical protein
MHLSFAQMVRFVVILKEGEEGSEKESEEESDEEDSMRKQKKKKKKVSTPKVAFVKKLAFKNLYVAMLVKSPSSFVDELWRQLPPELAREHRGVSKDECTINCSYFRCILIELILKYHNANLLIV